MTLHMTAATAVMCLLQAAALSSSLQQHLVQQMQDTLRWAVVEAAAAQPWHSHRPPLRPPGSHKQQQQQQQQQQQVHTAGQQQQAGTGSSVLASPAVRQWHVLLQAWLYVLRRVLPTRIAADILAQVICLAKQRQAGLCSLPVHVGACRQTLPAFQQDLTARSGLTGVQQKLQQQLQ
jgi:hypothetical protein